MQLTGTVLDGRYRVGSAIARGGMSTVYRGLDTRLERPVAIKVMAAQYAGDASFLTRFSREARLAASLSHPGIVGVYDHGRDGDQVFLVMELVDGGTLRDLLHQRGPLPLPLALTILDGLLQALAVAHRAGLVHRDVKPENVLLSSSGQLKVADFGLVRAVSSQTMATGDVILGTVAYLSPEQVERGVSDPRSDVYSAGIVAWEMLTGEPPFTGENSMSVAYQHVHSDVPLIGDVVPGVPSAIEDLLADATDRNPARRPTDAGDFAARLDSLCERLDIPLVDVPVPRRATPTGPPPAPHPAPAHPAAQASARPPATVAVVTGNRSGAGPAGTKVVPSPRTATAAAPPPGHPSDERVPAEPPRVRRRSPWVRRIVWLVVILLLGVAAAIGGWWLGDGRWAYTPATVGLTQQAAEAAVRQAGLVPRLSRAPADAPVGVVAGSTPDAGARLLRGSTIAVIVSTGPVPVAVPAVAGKSVEDAENKLKLAGFRIGLPVPRFAENFADGTVLATEPVAGQQVPHGGTVRLVVNTSAAVPDLRGRPVPQAVAELTAAGWSVTVGSPSFDAVVVSGLIVGTVPQSGTRMDPARRSVTLFPSSAVVVPDLTTGTVADADAALTAMGLTADVNGWFVSAGTPVGEQTPAAGTLVPPGSQVQIGR